MLDQEPTADQVWTALCRGADGRDDEELDRIARHVQGRLSAMLARRVRDRDLAEDLAQEAFLSTLRFAKAGAGRPSNLDGFLYFRMRDVVTRRLRKPSSDETTLSPDQQHELIVVIVDPTEPLRTEELVAALVKCLERLSPTLRQAWEARYGSGHPALHLPTDDDQGEAWQLSRARHQVVACLEEKGSLKR